MIIWLALLGRQPSIDGIHSLIRAACDDADAAGPLDGGLELDLMGRLPAGYCLDLDADPEAAQNPLTARPSGQLPDDGGAILQHQDMISAPGTCVRDGLDDESFAVSYDASNSTRLAPDFSTACRLDRSSD